MKPEVLDLRETDDPRDVVHRVVERLAQGGLVALPTETLYVLAASLLIPAAVERLLQAGGSSTRGPLRLGIKSSDEAMDWVPGMSALGRRLVRRCWPGPVTLIFNNTATTGLVRQLPTRIREVICPEGHLGMRVPAHPVVLDCQRLLPWPLVLACAAHDGQPLATTREQVVQNMGDQIDLVLDDGPCRYGQPSSVVRISAERWEILQEGVVTESAIRRMARCLILFVCTGNTCRSPMAEAICKMLLAQRLGCKIEQLPEHGYEVISAGLAACTGDRASQEAIEVILEMGGDLNDHFSHALTAETVYQADYVFAMTDGHVSQLASLVPEAMNRISLLRPDGGNIADPVGMTILEYRRSAQDIEYSLQQILAELLP